jgi:hypothetical protein
MPVSHPISFGQSVPVSQPISFGQSVPNKPNSFDYDSGRRHHCNYDHMSVAKYLLLNDLSLSIDYCEKLQRELQVKMNLQ